jgi:hypothetical protein
VHVAIAARASLRCFPAALKPIVDKRYDSEFLMAARAILTSTASLIAPTADMIAAAEMSVAPKYKRNTSRVSTDAAFFAATATTQSRNSAQNAVNAVISATYSAGGAAEFVYNSTYRDCTEEVTDQPISIFYNPLWEGKMPAAYTDAWDLLSKTSEPDLAFWRNWYRGFLDGAPLDWELQKRVALIPNDVWDQGGGAVAEAIREIETNYLRETTHAYEDPNDPGDVAARLPTKQAKLILTRTEVAQPLVQDPKTETFTLDRASTAPSDPVAFAHESIKHALRHALDTSKPNALKSEDEEVQLLKFALETLPMEARHLGPAFHQVHVSLDAKFTSGAYPDALATLHLCNQLKAHVSLFAESDPEVTKHIETYGELAKPRSVSNDTADDLRNAAGALEDVLEKDAQEAIEQLADTIEAGKPPSKFEMAVLTHWLTQIGLYLDKAKKGEARFAWLVSLLKRLWDVWSG